VSAGQSMDAETTPALWLTPAIAAQMLERPLAEVERLIAAGRLHPIETAEGRFFDPAEIDRLSDELASPTASLTSTALAAHPSAERSADWRASGAAAVARDPGGTARVGTDAGTDEPPGLVGGIVQEIGDVFEEVGEALGAIGRVFFGGLRTAASTSDFDDAGGDGVWFSFDSDSDSDAGGDGE